MASFSITFTRPVAVIPTAAGPSDLEFGSMVMELCELLAETDCVFGITGFGQAKWPVDVPYDLSTLVEQLPEALDRLRSGAAAEFDLYGQGVERNLRFEVDGDRVALTCVSRTGWIPDPAKVELAYPETLLMLESVANEFAESLIQVWPQHAAMAPFADWLRV